MELNNTQLGVLKTWVMAQNPIPGDQEAVDELNALASPVFNIYRSDVPVAEVMLNGFDWTRVDNLSVGKARIWEWLTTANPALVIDFTKPNIRAGVNATWVGTAQDLAVRAAVYTHAFRPATLAEQLFSVGAGTTPAADGSGPGTASATGLVTLQNIVDALNLP